MPQPSRMMPYLLVNSIGNKVWSKVEIQLFFGFGAWDSEFLGWGLEGSAPAPATSLRPRALYRVPAAFRVQGSGSGVKSSESEVQS